MARYIGVTIGPIYQTIKAARSTGELWGSSYIFSYLMKNMITKMKISGSAYLVPYVPDSLNDPPLTGPNEAGLFPDRFIVKVDDNMADPLGMVRETRDQVLVDFASKMAKKLPEAQDTVHKYIEQYIRFYAVLYDAKDDCQVVKEINQRLDTLELCARPVPKETDNYIAQFIQNKHIKNSFLYEDAFGSHSQDSLPMMHHIAAWGSGACLSSLEDAAQNKVIQDIRVLLNKVDNNKKLMPAIQKLFAQSDIELQQLEAEWENWLKKNRQGINDQLVADINAILFSRQKEFFALLNKECQLKGIPFKKAYKYVAVVKADGDGVGKYISSYKAGENLAIRNFSKHLFDFGRAALTLIKDYGGKPIYIGGDDLLFLAPLVSKKNQSIFKLLDDISSCFQNSMKSNDASTEISLSFGVCLAYYGYPLYESLEKADNYLKKAKNNKLFLQDKEAEKNSLGVSLIKHSGSSCDRVFGQSSDSYKIFRSLLDKILQHNCSDQFTGQQERFLNGLMYKLAQDRCILAEILKDKDYEHRLGFYFDNNFDEQVHKQAVIVDYFNQVKELIIAIYKETGLPQCTDDNRGKKEEKEKQELLSQRSLTIDRTVACLQLIKFFQEEGDE